MKIRVLFGLATMILGSPTLAYGQASELAQLRAEIQALTERLVALEANQMEIAETPPPAPGAPTPLLEGVKLKADLRYRHESIDDDASAGRRDRHRIRARIGLSGAVTEAVDVGFQLATGGPSPASANQSLDTSFSRKSIGLDLAYFNWKLGDQLVLTGGKMKNPFHRAGGNGLIWDSDLNPEGLALAIGSGAVTGSVAGLWVEERSGGSDSILLGGQLAYAAALGGDTKLKIGGGYFDYLKVEDQSPFLVASGNLLDVNGNYPTDFNELELFAELSTQVAERPLAVFFDYVKNTEANAFDTGWALGGKYGKASGPGTWEVGYVYQDLEANAVVGIFADSDFAGGGTDGSGHIIKGAYALNKKMKLNLTYFLNERGADAGNERDYSRLQADFSVKY